MTSADPLSLPSPIDHLQATICPHLASRRLQLPHPLFRMSSSCRRQPPLACFTSHVVRWVAAIALISVSVFDSSTIAYIQTPSSAWVCMNVDYLSLFPRAVAHQEDVRWPQLSEKCQRKTIRKSGLLMCSASLCSRSSALRSYPRPFLAETSVPAWALLDVAVSLRHTPSSLGLPGTTDASRFISNRALLT